MWLISKTTDVTRIEKRAGTAEELILDINLPDVTGHDLLERILLIDPDAHVIMLSGNADQTNIVQAMSKGAKGFIAKPFELKELRDELHRLLDAEGA